MVKLEVITIVIFLLGTCLCQSTVPCVDLVDGREVGTGGFSDPTYFNGQSLGQYNRSVMSQVNGELLEQMDFNFTGISWWWDSRSYGTTTPIPAPILRHKLPAELSYGFASYFAPSINGELFREDTFTRACGTDNETLVNGPGQFKPQETGSWQFFHMKPYNITFWRQLYVPKGPSANWARMVHFIQADQDTEINYWTYSTFVWSLKTLFAHPQSVPTRYQIYTDLDQVTYLRMPTAINYMGKNGRVIVTGANSLDCYSLHTSAAPFKLKAGETVAFAYFASLGFDDNKAVSTAQWLDSQPAEAFAKLTNDELSQIMNWDACAAVLGPQVTVKVDQSDKCSKTPTLTIALTTSLSYTPTHRVIRADGSVAQSVSDTSFTMSESGTFTLETWMNNCVVKRTPFDIVINDATFDTSTQTITGSNEPFTFKYDSQTKTLTATDAHGCETEAVLGTSTVSNTAFIAVDIVVRMIFAALTLLL